MNAPATRRRSRWDRAPALDGRGRERHALITERDIEIFKLLARYRYLSIDDIHAFVGGSRKGLAHHINLLCRRPNLYLNRPHQQRQSADANHRPMIYELDRKGVTALQDFGLPVVTKDYCANFAHEVMVCRVMASFELGALEIQGLRLVTWPEILASGKVPTATIQSKRPLHIPVSIAMRGKELPIEINADGKPFGIEYCTADAPAVYRFFPGVEADRGTEPLQAYDIERSSISKKFLAYVAIERAATYRSHFGFPNMLIPFITSGASRLRSMMELLGTLTEGRGSRTILFKDSSALADRNSLLFESWQRVGFPSLNLSERAGHSP